MAANLLEQAEEYVETFCGQLSQLLLQARQQQKSLETEARQLRRLLDEIEVRLSLARGDQAPAPASVDQLVSEQGRARQQEENLLTKLSEAEESSRRLELLLRQVEMSGLSLRSETHLRSYDPWELALRSQVLFGREQERSALAREVHDGPAQVLSNLALGLNGSLQTETLEEALASAQALLRDARLGLQEVRRFIYDLRPSPLAEEPLSQQIERYVRDMEATYQLEIEFHWGTAPRELSPEEKVAIYRIVQEALHNARKHARAGRISVEAYVEPTAWVVRVADDGVGFNPKIVWHQEDHWGIRGMRERAQLIGADLQIDSQAGEGTTVLLRLSLLAPTQVEERS